MDGKARGISRGKENLKKKKKKKKNTACYSGKNIFFFGTSTKHIT